MSTYDNQEPTDIIQVRSRIEDVKFTISLTLLLNRCQTVTLMIADKKAGQARRFLVN